jgi:hypothetical protein
MFIKILILSFLLVLTNCAVPGSALLGPAVTGATTKSTVRTTLSYASNKVIKNITNLKINQKHKDLFNFHN